MIRIRQVCPTKGQSQLGRLELHIVDSQERQYLALHVERVRPRVRVWFSVFSLLSILCTIYEVRRFGPWQLSPLLHLTVLLPCSLTLTWLTWSRHYRKFYLSSARALAPICGMLVAGFVAKSVADGLTEHLAAMPVHLIAMFFFTGLLFREALATALGMVLTFWCVAMASGMAMPTLFKSMAGLTLTGAVGAMIYRDIERSYRRNFIDSLRTAELAVRDALSGLMNRRAFDEHLQRIWQHAQRDRRSVTLLMIDIDHFKQYNDTSGHQAGDVALRTVAGVIQDFARRPLDLAARFGGEEFALIVYDLTMPQARELAEQIRRSVETTAILSGSSALNSVTVSIGACTVTPTLGRTVQGALQLADEALYEAKHRGRNCVVIKGQDEYKELTTGEFRRPRLASVRRRS